MNVSHTRNAMYVWLLMWLAALLILLAVIFVHIHGWNDITIGTDTAYCGIHFQTGQSPFYCQSGN